MKKNISMAWILMAAAIPFHPLPANSQDAAPVMIAAAGEEALLFQEIPSVIGASKYEQKVTEAPSSVSIVTSADIRKYGYRTLADILKGVLGFFVTYDRNYSYVGVRGFGRPGDYNSRILLLIDGHRTNDNIYNQAMIGTEALLDVDLIDRVEIIRGPGSSLYGSNAFFGVINIITKRGRNLKGVEVSAEAGSFETAKGRVSYGDRYQNGLEAILSASAYDSKGGRLYFPEYDDPATNNGITEDTDYDRAQNLFTTLAFGDFTVQGGYASRTKGIPTGAFGTDFNDPRNKTVDIRTYGDLKFERGVTAKSDLSVRFFYDYYSYKGDYAYYTDPATAALNKDSGTGAWWGTELKLIGRLGERQRLIAGAEFQDNLRQDQDTFYDPYDPASHFSDARRSRTWAAYLQDEVTISPSLILNAGVRYDHYDTFGDTTNPRIALIAVPAEKSTVKLLYGSAFRAPNDYELYYAVDAQSANPELEPERIKTTEVVFEQYLGDHLRASVSGYYYQITNLINYGDDPLVPGNSQFQNISEVSAKGSEVELDGKWASGLEARIGYAIQRTKDEATGDPLSNSPAQMGKIALNVPVLAERVFLGVEELYLDRRRTEGGIYAASFFLTNLTVLIQDILPRLEASASVYNIFDKAYGDPVSADLTPLDTVQQDGRAYRLKLTYAF